MPFLPVSGFPGLDERDLVHVLNLLLESGKSRMDLMQLMLAVYSLYQEHTGKEKTPEWMLVDFWL